MATPALRATRDLAAFLRRPRGAALVGGRFVYAHPAPDLFVTALFGRPDAGESRTLLEALRVELEPRIAAHVSLVDARRVDGVDAGAFGALAAYVQQTRAELASKVTRLCLLRPDGMSGAVVAGFFTVVDPPYPVLVATSLAEASAFLGAPAPLPLLRAVDALVASVADRPAVIVQVEQALAADGFTGDLASVARALALSPRTLQRRLADAGTAFVDVQRGARLREAERRLLESEAPVTVIAVECGWSSPQHFAADFRSAHGVTASAWRRSRQR